MKTDKVYYASTLQHEDKTLEFVLIYHLVKSASRKRLLSKCFPSLFTDKDIRIIFSTIKELDSKGMEVSSFSVSNILAERHKKDRNYLIFLFDESYKAIANEIDPDSAIDELKRLLYKRLSCNVINNLIDAVEQSTEKSGVIAETNKLIALEASLLNKRLDSIEDLAKLTSERINTTDDIIITGFPFLNKRIGGLTRKGLSGLLARPSHGKSTLSGSLMYETVRTTNNVGLFISLEDPAEEIIKRMVAQSLHKSLIDMRFKKITIPHSDILYVMKNTLGGRLHVVDTRHVLTPEDAASVISDVKPTFVVVDYLQNFRMDDMIQGIIKALQILDVAANRNNCHILVCSQVPDKQIFGREDPYPTASDTMWTSALYQKSAELFSLYYQYADTRNQFQINTLGFRILKNKFSSKLDDIQLNIDTHYGQIIGEFGYE